MFNLKLSIKTLKKLLITSIKKIKKLYNQKTLKKTLLLKKLHLKIKKSGKKKIKKEKKKNSKNKVKKETSKKLLTKEIKEIKTKKNKKKIKLNKKSRKRDSQSLSLKTESRPYLYKTLKKLIKSIKILTIPLEYLKNTKKLKK